MSDPILVSQDDDSGVATVMLHAPETGNPLSEHLLAALKDTLQDLSQADALSAMILTGAGGTFCRGFDLAEIRDAQTAPAAEQERYFYDLFLRTAQLAALVRGFPKPVIALLEGTVASAGLHLALSATELRAAEGTVFQVADPETGLLGAGAAVRLFRRWPEVGVGAQFDAETALRHGFLAAVSPADRLLADGVARAIGLGGDAPPPAAPELGLAREDRDAARRMAKALSLPDARRLVREALVRRQRA
ncbi:MAG: enoyl-CoA hydratase/isomerase family protein [Pseudomonadota bacterium]